MSRKRWWTYGVLSVLIVGLIGLAAVFAEAYLDPAEVCDWGLRRGRC